MDLMIINNNDIVFFNLDLSKSNYITLDRLNVDLELQIINCLFVQFNREIATSRSIHLFDVSSYVT